MSSKTNVLYISYDGMTDPLGQSQVLSYLRILSQHEFSFHILSYEKEEMHKRNRSFVENFISGYDISWHPLSYTNTPPVISTVNNIRQGKKKIKELTKVHHFKIVHCRGYISSIMGAWLKKRTGVKFIFDMRGWWADEKKEAGDWRSLWYQPVYSFFKRREKFFFRDSDLSISLTHSGKKFITEKKLKEAEKVDIIPTCVNFDIFPSFDPDMRKKIRQALELPADVTVMVYSGSLGGNYRTDLALLFFRYLLEIKPDTYFLFITQSEASLVKKEILQSGLNADRFRVVHAAYADVNNYLMAGDIGVIMYDKRFSAIGRSPTKLGEYWACGLKMLSARGIGDLDYLANKYPKGGVLANTTERDDMKKAVEAVLKLNVSREELRTYAMDYFDLQKGCSRYLQNYRKLAED